jgi:hypothetical protein
MRFPGIVLITTALLGSGAFAAPAPAKAPVPAGPALKSISVLPNEVTLLGPRSEQGFVVTGQYADGSVRDLSAAAKYTISNPKVARYSGEARPEVFPVGDGAATITVSVPGAAPQTVNLQVKDFGKDRLVSFKDEVVPALTKAGCSQGICHGTPTGKGGFRLSLQGYAPEMDFNTLVREGGGRRVNTADPGRSLILLKPMVEMPHGGGKRLSADMPEYDVLVRWIAQGAHYDEPDAPTLEKMEILPSARQLMLPNAKQQIVAMAKFSDGTLRDVTDLAKLDTSNPDAATISRTGMVEASERGDIAILVRYQYALQSQRLTLLKKVPGFEWNNPPESNFVDKAVFERLKLFQIPVSELSTDAEFVRRAYLDTVGLLPTASEVRRFLEDKAPDRRAKLIDELTQRPEFADYWSLKWADVLRISDDTLGESAARAYHKWVRDSFAANKPMDQFVREILTAQGSIQEHPAANFFRAARDSEGLVKPDTLSQAATQLFFGVRMTCAKCHNHPFERWTQDDYYALAAFFGQVKPRGDGAIGLDPKGEVEHLRTGRIMKPKLLGGDYPQIKPGEDRRVSLATWLTAKDNPFFAKAMVNRVWANLLGRGIVEPIDDFRDSNPPVNPALLEALAKDFVDNGFDFRHLVRTIMNSRTYQLAAQTIPLNHDDGAYFSHALPRMLSAEQLADAISQLTGVPDDYTGYPKGTRAMQIAGNKSRTDFLKTFGRPDRNLNCECEREKDPTMLQALKLLTDREIHAKLESDSGNVAHLAASGAPEATILEEMYYAALSRPPSAKEKQGWLAHFSETPDRRAAVEDLAWVLINSKEFLFRH